jgi:C-terminal processing protease CtpA/Prc
LRPLALLPGLILLLPSSAKTPVPKVPTKLQNGFFTKGKLGEMPLGWTVPKALRDAGFRVALVSDTALPAKRAVEISRLQGSGLIADLMQTLDATPYRGKRVRLTSLLRCEPVTGSPAQAQLWLRVYRPGQSMGFYDDMNDRPIRTSRWTWAEIVGDVAADAQFLALGAMLTGGNGTLGLASVRLEVLGNTPNLQMEGPRALSARGTENLEAFAQALNYVRFFHPSDEAARADWNRLAPEGVRAVEGAVTSSDLAARLQTFFAPYATLARFLPEGQAFAPPPRPSGAVGQVRWIHTGYSQKNQQEPYQSRREYQTQADTAPKGWRHPMDPATYALAGGVHLWLPSTCYTDPQRATLPKAAVEATAKVATRLPEPTRGPQGSGEDRATRLGDVALAWGVFQHFYPYFDVVGTDWRAELPRALLTAATDTDAAAFSRTLNRMVAALKDGHGYVQDWNSAGSSNPSLGLTLLGETPVVKFSTGSAASVPTGSRILSVDGEAVAVRMARLRSEISAANPGWMAVRLERQLLLGPAGTRVRLEVALPSGETVNREVPREKGGGQQVDPRLPAQVAELRPGIWYVDLDRISDQEFEKALPSLAAAKGVIFDLRGYPKMGPSFLQHLTDNTLESAYWNVPIVTQPDGQGWEWDLRRRWTLPPLGPRIGGKVAFLTGGGAISYAESCLGIVEAYKLAEIVGEPSAGTNGSVNPFTLPGGFYISWTGMKVLKHDDSRHHGVGILPTVPVSPTLKGLAEGRDEVLEMGLKVVSR